MTRKQVFTTTVIPQLTMPNRVPCAFCKKDYQYTAAYFSHLKLEHADRIRYVADEQPAHAPFRIRDDFIELFSTIPRDPATVYPDDSETDSDEIQVSADDHAESEEPVAHTVQFDGAGLPFDDTIYPQDDVNHPYKPFRSQQEYDIARWCVRHRIPKSAIDVLFSIPGFNTLTSTTSSHVIFNRIDAMEWDLGQASWKHAKVCFDRRKDINCLRESDMTSFWYRNPVSCLEFLMRQPAYRESMAYAPVQEFNGDGERMFSEIATADWWWRQQVR